MNQARDRNLLLNVYCLFYYAVLFFFFLDQRLLSQYQPIFLTYNRDLSELLLIGSGLPAYAMAHRWVLLLADVLAFALPILILAHVRLRGRLSPVPGVIFTVFLGLYLLLINLFWQADHEPFMLYFFLSLTFWTNHPKRFYAVLRFCRYYFCYVFVSAAIWKIARGAVFQLPVMSHILLDHQGDLLSASCDTFWCRVCWFLIDHPALSWSLYCGAILLELFFVVGFFTRRLDHWLIAAAVIFVAADFWLMRIPYWTLLIGCITLYIGASDRKRHHRGIVIYETTHHENLPALLDLCERQFERTAVFLRRLSFDNLCGYMDPRRRWPKALFVIQESSNGNRAFIGKLFGFLRKHRNYTHLHLSTLDSNWLLVAVRLVWARELQVSMTVHAVNEYFSRSAGGFKAITESLARFILHRRIRHYTFFLPVMAEEFHHRMPGAVTVSIPSRFYEGALSAHRSEGPFVIVIPGTVDPHRRDYESVIDFFSRFSAKRPIELVLLGSSHSDYGATIVKQLRQLESERFHVTAFDGYVSQSVYEQRYASADLIWAPLKPEKTSTDKVPEVYGQTIASGLTADLQLANSPVLAPDWLVLPPPFSTTLLPYSSQDAVASLIHRLLDDPDYRRQLGVQIDQAFTTLCREHFTGEFRRLMALDGSTSAEKPSKKRTADTRRSS
jgi:hypothetical protein